MNQPKTVRKTAVALGFEPGQDSAPRVAAKGAGKLAEQILELARQHDVPIRQDRDLVQVLSRLDLQEEIPPELYRAVAEILAFIYLASREASGFRLQASGWSQESDSGRMGTHSQS